MVKIGRRGATGQLRDTISLVWRTHEVCKLKVHDHRSSKEANRPRMNLLLRELEVLTGGTVISATGSAIWLYRYGAETHTFSLNPVAWQLLPIQILGDKLEVFWNGLRELMLQC